MKAKCFISKFKGTRIAFIILFTFFFSSGSGQRDIKAILKKITAINSDTAKIRLYLEAATHYERNISDSCIYFANKALGLLEKNPNDASIAHAYSSLASSYILLENYAEAMRYVLKGISVCERSKDSSKLGQNFVLMGSILLEVSSEKKSLSYYNRALEIGFRKKDTSIICNVYNDFAYIYNLKGELDSALHYLLKVYEIDQIRSQADKEELIASDENNIGSIYYNLRNVDKAEFYFMRSYERRRKLGYKLGIMQSLNSLAALYYEKKEYKKIIPLLKESRALAIELDSKSGLASVYHIYSNVNRENGFYQAAALYSDSLLDVKEQLFNEEKARISDESESKYQNEKKKLENAKLQERNELSEKVIKQQKQTFYIISFALCLTLALAYIAFRSFRKQRAANVIIEKQKKLVDEKQKEILDSIKYAKRIQSTLLAHEDILAKNIPNNFILFKPKDIVSGDFYWATENEKRFYLAVCDSTGHGVPGAFMSLLNIGFLSEAINEKGIERPNDIFNYVRGRLIASISKEDQKDGFDGILLCIDSVKKKLSYAAANNEPIVISNGAIKELEKDKMPVGKGVKEAQFSLFELDLKPGETLYMYTDGYADQFGGEKGKKFLYKKLNQLIASIAELPFPEQKQELEKAFDSWKGAHEQVDDVLLIGLRV